MCKQNKKYIKYQTIENKNKNYQKIYWQIGKIGVILNQQKEIRKEQNKTQEVQSNGDYII